MKLPHMRKPCKDCPFRKDSMKGWLGRERMQEILGSESFVCHKDNSKQCAGHMLIKGPWNTFVAMAQRLGIDLPLRGRKLVFDTEKDCLDHHDDSFKRDDSFKSNVVVVGGKSIAIKPMKEISDG